MRTRLPASPALFLLVWASASAPAGAADLPADVTSEPDGASMKLVPAGPFAMGSETDEPDERPAWRPDLSAFYIDVHEVTNARYAKFCLETKRAAPVFWKDGAFPQGQEEMPVTNVTWFDAAAYARWAGKRLPTEAEWEKAARGTDGRRFCWGNEPDDAMKKHRGEPAQSGPLPVGSLPDGVSPFGCHDMIGNVWEWTGDWYGPYPGNPEPSVHYGKKYKAVRGGGFVGFYGAASGARCADRMRVLPYGWYDALGFRCAKDAPGVARDTTDPDEDPARWKRKLDPPKPPDRPPAGPVRLTVAEPAGAARRNEVVTSGVPFPQGMLKAPVVTLRDDQGRVVPCQAQTTATWQDGSVRWLLVDFPVTLGAGGERHYALHPGESPPVGGESPLPHAARVEEGEDGVTVTTGPLRVRIEKGVAAPLEWVALDRNADGTFEDGERLVGGGLLPTFRLSAYRGRGLEDWRVSQALPWDPAPVKGGPIEVAAEPPDEVVVEEKGPVRAAIRTSGWVLGPGKERLLRYQFRIWAFAGSTDVRVWYTFTHLSKRPMILVDEASLSLIKFEEGGYTVGGAVQDHEGTSPRGFSLVQEALGPFGEDTAYRFDAGDLSARGTRAPGWINLGGAAGLTLGVRHFWEQYPKAFSLSDRRSEAVVPVSIHLWTGPRAFYADRGIAKTHELWLHVHDGKTAAPAAARRHNAPLFAAASPEWYCASGAFDEQEPFDYDAYPFFESSIDAGADRRLKSGPWGMRDFGDAYMGGINKGKNAFNNLEYDVAYQSFQQFFRTGLRKHLDLGVVQARHQEDIDTNHVSGKPWKHGPRHTTNDVEGGHLFARGILAHYHLTGERRGLDVAREIGDWIAKDIRKPNPHGNERQIGWTLYTMSAVYEATWDEKHKAAVLDDIRRLLARQDARGKFDIRYDNRISFFNGATGAAFLTWHRLTGDEAIREGMRRHMERSLAYLPEYSARSQWAYGWLAEQDRDSRFLDAAERSFETSLENYVRRGAAWVGQNGTQYHPLRRRYGLVSPVGRPLRLTPAQLAVPGLQRRSFHHPKATWLIQDPDGGPFDIAVYRFGGRGEGRAAVTDAGGAPVADLAFLPTGGPDQQGVAAVAASAKGAVYRVACVGMKTLGWDLVTTRPVRAVLHLPGWADARVLPGRIWFEVPKGASRVRFAIASAGEGYHGATLYDAEGRPVACVTRFIDLDDARDYADEVQAPVEAGQDGRLWSVDIRDVRVTAAEGAGEYVAESAEGFFRP